MKKARTTIDQCREVYALNNWSDGYFDINPHGHVSVKPSRHRDYQIDLRQLAQSLPEQGLSFPVLVRFIDILQDRVQVLQKAFDRAIKAQQYQGRYTPVYPIKVNQQKTVLEGILKTKMIGLEAGSKAELLAILGMPVEQPIICNGYKDSAYIRYALIGLQMGMDVYLVIEKLSELDMIIEQSQSLGIQPQLGIRIRLSSISAGQWQNSGGAKSKFGLHASQVIDLVDDLRQAGMLDSLQLMHFHMGSQIANIDDINTALHEAARYYAELHQLGVAITVVDVGGGLAIDYDGTHSCQTYSMNYNLQEYAVAIVTHFSNVCTSHQLPHPNLITESGRAITAHHALLITNVIEVEQINPLLQPPLLKENLLECYEDANDTLLKTRTQFLQQQTNLQQLANAEQQYLAICQAIRAQLDPHIMKHQALITELDEKLADKIFCNFSLFQSLPDAWGIDQVFPIMPIHHLQKIPERRGIIHDLTCDSDGQVDVYVDRGGTTKTLAVHDIKEQQPYYLGFFLLGAYQEILGDMHNLFGDTDSINIELDENGYHLAEAIKGEHISDLLEYVHISPDQLKQHYQQKLQSANLTPELQTRYQQELCNGLIAATYLGE